MFRRVLLFLNLVCLIAFTNSCGSSRVQTVQDKETIFEKLPDSINKKWNRKFAKSRKSFIGKIDSLEVKRLYKNFGDHLNTTLQRGKSVIIHYKQKGDNCFEYNQKSLVNINSNIQSISSRFAKAYQMQPYFVFAQDAFNKKYYQTLEYYFEDSGFFKSNIFNLEEVCSAFFLIKPNGEFLKFYGTDYFSEVKDFMESELVFQKN